MKVLQIAPSFARRDGGPSEVLRGTLPALWDLGLDVELATTDKGTSADDALFAADPRIHVFRARPPHSWTFSPELGTRLGEFVRGFDVVHLHSVNTYPTTVGMRAALRAGIPYLIQPHGALDDYHMAQGGKKKELYNRLVDGRALRAAAGFIYSTPRELDHGTRRLPFGRPFQVPLGVDPALFSLVRTPSKHPTILFLGRVTEKKRLDLVIRALALLPAESDIRLLVAGPVDERLPYDPIGLVEELSLGERVDFVGPVDAVRRADLLRTSSVFVLPSEDESFGVATAEALAASIPVVASENVGIVPGARRAEALIPCLLSPKSIAEGISQALAAPRHGYALGARGREYAREHFTWDSSAGALVHAYRSVARGVRV